MDYKDVVTNVRVYDLEECLQAAGYPMKTELIDYKGYHEEQDMKRAKNLVKASVEDNQAHIQFLTGIRVNFDLTFSNKAWVEAERYRFLEFVSSQSTMHRAEKFDYNECCDDHVDKRIIDIMNELVEDYRNETDGAKKKEKLLHIVYSNPAGFRLTARMTTNYRCLRNIYKQRKNHRLPEWRAFCKWIETLPYAEELLIN